MKHKQNIQQNYDALTAFIGWIVDAMSYVPVPDAAKPALDALLSTQKELREKMGSKDEQ